ncbi:hypothetical protein, partial [Phocaeicola vulgatus]|uniref:hypothetical protein n=1 Tax=Phocaeicola vulgatus TaxID=821 RepID=UPI001E2B7095
TFLLFLNTQRAVVEGIFPLFGTLLMVRCSHLSTLLGSFAQATTKVLQFPIKARGQQFKSIIFEGVKSAACQISLCRK